MSQPNPVSLTPLWDDLSLRPYLGEIRRRHGIVEILALPSMRDLPPMRIETLFVPPLLAEGPVSVDSDPKQWPQGQSLFAALERNPCLVVLGDPGSGKTTLANWLAWRLSAGLTAPLPKVLEDRVPLPCVLREMKADIFTAETTLPDLAESVTRRLLGDKVDAALLGSLRQRVATGSYVLILDGVDEISISHRKVVAGWVRQAAAQQACVLATSRIVGYEDGPVDREKAALRLDLRKGLSEKLGNLRLSIGRDNITADTQTDQSAWAQRCHLMPFNPDQIAAFAENWYRQRCGTEHEAREKAADLLAALNRSEVTQRLARTPNLLALMAIVYRERAHLPDGKALLYDEIANAYINTIDSQRKIEPGDTLAPFGWKERKAWLARVGFEMQQRRSEETEEAEEPGEINRDAGVLAREADVLAWLTDAMRTSGVVQPERTARAYLGWVARRSGLLLPRGEGFHAFGHLSFQEYFCACFLADRIVSPTFVKKGASSDGLVNRDLLRQWGGESVWRETLVFLFELLSAERDTDWTDNLVEILFGSDADFGYDCATLGARLLADRHVRLGQAWEEFLVDLCSGWIGFAWSPHGEILALLVDAGYAAITEESLGVVRHETRLRVLIVQSDMVVDVSSLAELNALRVLNLSGTGVTDLSPLAELNALRVLNLSGTGVTDLSPLVGLNTLKDLEISGTGVTDLSPLAGLNALRVLNLSGTGVTDLSPLAGLSALQELDLNGTGVTDLSPLAGLSALQEIDLSGTRVTDVSPLVGLRALEILDLSNTGVTDVSQLAGLRALEILDLSNTGVTDLRPLAKLSALHNLHLSNTGVTDLSPLAGLSALQDLYFSSTEVTDLRPLAKLSALRWLDLSNTRVTDLSLLAELSALQWLNLSGTGVTDLSPLAGLSALQWLTLSGTRVADLSPLAGLSALRRLNLEGTRVTDVSPLAGLPDLDIFIGDKQFALQR